MSAAHPGFANVASSIARREGISKERGAAIAAAAARNASKSAKRSNPRLLKVKS